MQIGISSFSAAQQISYFKSRQKGKSKNLEMEYFI